MTHETVAWPWWADAFWAAAVTLFLGVQFIVAPRILRRRTR